MSYTTTTTTTLPPLPPVATLTLEEKLILDGKYELLIMHA